jgi:hypothetical protein
MSCLSTMKLHFLQCASVQNGMTTTTATAEVAEIEKLRITKIKIQNRKTYRSNGWLNLRIQITEGDFSKISLWIELIKREEILMGKGKLLSIPKRGKNPNFKLTLLIKVIRPLLHKGSL